MHEEGSNDPGLDERRDSSVEGPANHSLPSQSELPRDAREATRAYRWCLWTSLAILAWTLCFATGAGAGNSTLAVWPAGLWVVAILIFLKADPNSSLFARRHTEQASILAVLFFLSSLVGPLLSVIVLLGFVEGLRQVRRGDCWLMRIIGETDRLPTPSSVEQTASVASTAGTDPDSQPSPGSHFERGLSLLTDNRHEEAAAAFLASFRSGPPEIRQLSAQELQKLGKVETF